MTKRIATIVALLIVGLAGCGVPTDDEPRGIQPSQVPFDLLTPSTTQPATTVPVPTIPVTVFMLQGDKLAPVMRSIPAPATVGSALATLIQGPTDTEAAQGLRSAVSAQANVSGAQVTDSVATVDIAGDVFASTGAQDQIRALAQIVYTATSVPDVGSVQFRIDGSGAGIPRGDGSTTTGPVNRGDYAALAP